MYGVMLLALPALLLAQVAVQLPETVVVETRQPAPVTEASPSVSKIDATQAGESGYRSLTSLLGTTPGVFASEQGGEGSQSSLFIRGTNSAHTAVLLDGRRLPAGFSGSYELGRYRLFGLSSVEIQRGASSSLYGANSLGGVIDLRLQDPLTHRSGSTLEAETGSYGRASLGYAFATNNARAGQPATQGTALAFTSSHDDGWRANGGRDASTALVKSAWKLTPQLTADLIGSADRGRGGLPGSETAPSLVDWQKDSGWLVSPGLRYVDPITTATAFWSHGGTHVRSFTGGDLQSYRLATDELTAYADWKARADLSFGLGVTYERNAFDQLAYATPWVNTIESFGLWAHADWKPTSADRFKAGLRRDDFSDFAGKTTGDVTYSRRLTKELLAHAKVGTAYRAPAANDLAYGTHLNLPLRPESNTGFELGLRHENSVPGALSWTLVAFRNELSELIDFNPISYQTYNIAEARTQGLEAGLETRPAKGLRLFGAATWLDSQILSSDYFLGTGLTGDKLLRRPTVTLSVGAEVMPNDDWTFGVSAAHLRGREDFDWNAFARTTLPDATFVRLWIRRVLSDRTEISLRIENLFGEDAPPAAFGFPAQPRSAYLSLTRRF
jgi:vitamin B12 transporter